MTFEGCQTKWELQQSTEMAFNKTKIPRMQTLTVCCAFN